MKWFYGLGDKVRWRKNSLLNFNCSNLVISYIICWDVYSFLQFVTCANDSQLPLCRPDFYPTLRLIYPTEYCTSFHMWMSQQAGNSNWISCAKLNASPLRTSYSLLPGLPTSPTPRSYNLTFLTFYFSTWHHYQVKNIGILFTFPYPSYATITFALQLSLKFLIFLHFHS